MIALGVDVATSKIAFASIDEHGRIHASVLQVPKAAGARRLLEVRARTYRMVTDEYRSTCVAVVEIPWAKTDSSFALLSCAGVVMEAVQVSVPNAVVLDTPTQVWKLDSVGHGNATKEQVMQHANALGYEGTDQDIADAVCMAQAAWAKWDRRIVKGAA